AELEGQRGDRLVEHFSIEVARGQDLRSVLVGGYEIDNAIVEPYGVRGTVDLQPGQEGVAHAREKPRPRLAGHAVEAAEGGRNRRSWPEPSAGATPCPG